jgi:amino acid adenylation domain-containing protein
MRSDPQFPRTLPASPANPSRHLAATPQQEGIWFHAMSHSVSYWNFVYTKSYAGKFNIAALERSLDNLLRRHSSLRTGFMIEGNRLYQVIRDEVEAGDILQYQFYDEVCRGEGADRVSAEIARLRNYDFDLENEILFKFSVLEFTDACFLIVGMNHIITDELSMRIFWSELKDRYNAIVDEAETAFAPRARQYSDFSIGQSETARTEAYIEQKQYWLRKLSGERRVLDLPFHTRGSKTVSYYHEFELPTEMAEDIRCFSLRQRVLYSAVFQLAYYILLYKYSGQKEILLGNFISGRGFGKSGNNEVIGVFVNRLINRLELKTDERISDHLQRVNADLLASFANSAVPYEELMRELGRKNGNGGRALFQAAFNLMRFVDTGVAFSGMEEKKVLECPEFLDADTQYDIYLYVIDSIKSVRFRLELNGDEGLRPMVGLLSEAYLTILKECVHRPQAMLAEIELQALGEKAMIERFNSTVRRYPARTVHELFSEQANKEPDRIAILFGTESITYRELDRGSDELAAELKRRGAGRGKLTGLLLDRSPLIIKSMLAILKTGGAYLPMDPEFPTARLAFMLKDARAGGTLTGKGWNPEPGAQESSSLPPDIAYLIYTSGSTGTPKGVMVTHRSVVNFINGITERIHFHGKKIYSLTTVSFDIFVLESLLSLCAGATVVLGSAEEQQAPEMAIGRMIAAGVEMLQCTPSRIKMLLECADKSWLEGITDLMIGGEMLSPDLLQRIRSVYRGRVFNMYGPTETTVWSCMKDMKGSQPITIGGPISNTRIHILGEHDQPMGIGIYGEIGIAGDGLSAGYLGQDALTTEKFVSLPLLGDERVYKTGDIGRWLPDGDIEIKGRKDDQMKIRGYRVEPGDIEINLKSHPRVRDAVVLFSKDEDGEYLHAYYTANEAIPAPDLRVHLRGRLPEFMIPGSFIFMTVFPFTPNNKIDREALRSIRGAEAARLPDKENAEWLPEGLRGIDERLLSIWTRILQADGTASPALIGNFFESGGHSLKAIRLLNGIKSEFNLNISLRDFFLSPTIHYLNERLSAALT